MILRLEGLLDQSTLVLGLVVQLESIVEIDRGHTDGFSKYGASRHLSSLRPFFHRCQTLKFSIEFTSASNQICIFVIYAAMLGRRCIIFNQLQKIVIACA